MVALTDVQASNAQVASLPAGLVAVFVGATSGIGETTLKQFVKHARQPRVYFVGREQEAAMRITSELNTLNSEGQYNFIKADVSLIKVVDDVCKDIKSKETAINILFLTPGSMISHTETPESMHLASVLVYYARMRFIVNLLPLIQQAKSLRRVVTVFGGTKEGEIDTSDWQARKIAMTKVRGHMSSLISLSLETIAEKAPDVSFIYAFPGFVKTGVSRGTKGLAFAAMKAVFKVIGPMIYTPNTEVGERQLFLATSSRYPAAAGVEEYSGIPLMDGIRVAIGTTGKKGSGVYSVDANGDSAGPQVVELLAKYRKEGMAAKIWAHTEEEFKRITGTVAV